MSEELQTTSGNTPEGAADRVTTEERQWAMLAHLTILLNLVSLIGGPLAALVIYVVYRERSRYVAFHALQSLVFQLISWLGVALVAVVLAIVASILSLFFIGLFLWPFVCFLALVPLAAVGYSIVAAVACSRGEDFRYWVIGDWIASTFVEATDEGS